MSFFDTIGGDNNADGVEERVTSGGQLPPGFYRAKLDGARDSEVGSNNTPCYELTFLVTAGPFAGVSFTEKLFKAGKDAAATARCRDRVKLFAHRLGLIGKSADGKTYTPIAGKEGFGDVLDAECVVEIRHEADREDKTKMWARLAYAGVYLPTDPVAVAALANGGKRPDAPADTKAGQGRAGASPPPPPPPAAPAGRRRTGVDAL